MEDKQLVVFEDDRFGIIRTITDDSCRPWFAGKDVAGSLGYSDTEDAIRRHCKLSKLFKPGETPGWGCAATKTALKNRTCFRVCSKILL